MKNLIKSKKFLSAIVLLGIFLLGTGVGNGYATVPLGETKYQYEEANEAVLSKQDELSAVEDEIDIAKNEYESIQKDIEDQKAVIKEAEEFNENKESLTTEISDLESKLRATTKNIEEQEEMLEWLSFEVKEKEEAPIEIPAGRLTVGEDLPFGRYLIEPIGRGSNFKVNDVLGNLDISIILSTVPDHGVSEYIATLNAGSVIDSNTPAKLTPIE